MPRTPDEWSQQEDEELVRLEDTDLSWPSIAEAITKKFGTKRTGEAARKRFRRIRATGGPPEHAQAISPVSPELVFSLIRDNPLTLEQMANKLNVPPRVVREVLADMQEYQGYNLVETKGRVSVNSGAPKIETPEIRPLAESGGHRFSIGFASDIHVMSLYCQPTALNTFIRTAYERHGVRHVFDAGDVFSGLYGYRGHEEDLVPNIRPISRQTAWKSVEAGITMADNYHPKMDGMQYFKLGGNHDAWIINSCGIDAVRVLCQRREDMTYLGYDTAGIPLTDSAYLRLVHPSGGTSYAKSYKLQKFQEGLAIEALNEAIRQEQSPITSIICMGHLHQAIFLPTSPIMGLMPGAFEAQTNYLKRKGLVPDVGGTILEFEVGDDGKIRSTSYTFYPFVERKNDWERWAVPEIEDNDYSPDEINTIFKFEKT